MNYKENYAKEFRERVEMIKDIARTYGRTKGATELGKKYGVSKQRIQQLVVVLRKRGIDIPRMRKTFRGVVEVAVKELKREMRKENQKSKKH